MGDFCLKYMKVKNYEYNSLENKDNCYATQIYSRKQRHILPTNAIVTDSSIDDRLKSTENKTVS